MTDPQQPQRGNAKSLAVAGVRVGVGLLSLKAKLILFAIVAAAAILAFFAGILLLGLLALTDADSDSASNAVGGGMCADPATGVEKIEAINAQNGDGSIKSPVAEYPDSAMPTAAAIVATARSEGFSDQAAIIAITAAMGESSLGTNKDAMTGANGDGDQGLYQQRVRYRDGAWYGTPEQVQDPVWATQTFLNGTDNQYGHMIGLRDIKGWEGLAPAEAIHRVQRNDPDTNHVYSRNYEKAKLVFQAVSGVDPATIPGVGGVSGLGSANCPPEGEAVTATGDIGAVLQYAQEPLGMDYVFGGGDGNGPGTSNIRAEDRGQTGFDCSGLTAYAFQQGAGINLPRMASQQWAAYSANAVKESEMQPGDMIFYAYGRKGGDVDHVAIYLGDGKMVEASNSAQVVRITTARTFSNDSGTKGIVRVIESSSQGGGDAK